METSTTLAGWLFADWLGLTEPARGQSCLSGRNQGPAAPGEDRVSSVDQKSFRTLQLQQPGDETGDSRSILPRTVWKPQRHLLIADWQGLVGSVPGDGCPSGQYRGPAASEENKFPSLNDKSIYLQLQQLGDEYGDPPGRYRPTRCGKHKQTDWLLIGRGSWSQRAARFFPRANVEVAPLTGRLRSIPASKIFPYLDKLRLHYC